MQWKAKSYYYIILTITISFILHKNYTLMESIGNVWFYTYCVWLKLLLIHVYDYRQNSISTVARKHNVFLDTTRTRRNILLHLCSCRVVFSDVPWLIRRALAHTVLKYNTIVPKLYIIYIINKLYILSNISSIVA